MNLQELNYPMFETTKEEKEILKKAYTLLKEENHDYFLCCILEDNFKKKEVSEILSKIRSCGVKVLSNTLDVILSGEDRVTARKIWIEKLLNYTGETL